MSKYIKNAKWPCNELEKWRAIVLAWLEWVACFRGWRASVGGVAYVLAWVACLRGWRASVGGVLAWVAC